MFASPDPSRLAELWREKLAEAHTRYESERSAANRTEYLRVLRVFTDLIVRNEPPAEPKETGFKDSSL